MAYSPSPRPCHHTYSISYYIAGLSLKPSHNPKGNQPSKFQLAGVRRFGGVREQTNKQTHSLTDWRFYRMISKRSLVINIYFKYYSLKRIRVMHMIYCFKENRYILSHPGIYGGKFTKLLSCLQAKYIANKTDIWLIAKYFTNFI